jgi:hypothetical protein
VNSIDVNVIMKTTVEALLATKHMLVAKPDVEIRGISLTELSRKLREKGWSGVSDRTELAEACEKLGFRVVWARRVDPKGLCTARRVVTRTQSESES